MSDLITREEFSRLQASVTSIDNKLGRFEVLEERDKLYQTKFESLASELKTLNTTLQTLPDKMSKAIEAVNNQRRQDIEDLKTEHRAEMHRELSILSKDLQAISETSDKVERYLAMVIGGAAIVSVVATLMGSYVYDKILSIDEMVSEYKLNKTRNPVIKDVYPGNGKLPADGSK